MVSIDWQRSMHASNYLACYRSMVAKARPRIGKVVSIRWIAFPHIATYLRAFRLVIDISHSGASHGRLKGFKTLIHASKCLFQANRSLEAPGCRLLAERRQKLAAPVI